MRIHICLSILVVMAGALLAGCGGSSNSSPVVPSSPAASVSGSSSSADAVALISKTPITRSSYAHWLSVETVGGNNKNAGHRALAFLITSDWVLAEAAARRISVSEAEVKRQLAKLEKQSFPQAGSMQRFLTRSGETEADLLARIKVELLKSRIAGKVTASLSGSKRTSVLARFEKAFQQHWRHYTTCKKGYVMEDCSEYKGKREDLSAASPTANSSPKPATSSSTVSRSTGGMAPAPGGPMAIASRAFEVNGAIPKTYTCDGANISPPLEWQNVPAKAAALVLIIIDQSETGPASGIRWFVANISPHSKGVAAGQLPEGGIVGAHKQGHSGYGGICPPRGKTSTIRFVMYALSKKIPVSPGFQPSVAETEYGGGGLLLGQAAITIATYHRP